MNRSLVIGSRGSKLALKQAEQVRATLALLNPGVELEIQVIKTTGDVKTDPLSVIGGKGVFTREIEDALLDERIDIAVHSLKDLPTTIPETLVLSAICEREDPRDALILRRESKLTDVSIDGLPRGAVIGTSSQRRLAQLKYRRRDLVVKDLRGNVDTRLRKLDEKQYDGLILAAVGLRRLGLEHRISAAIPLEQMLPAVGQGAIGIETRADDRFVIGVVSRLDHANTHVACTAERALLRMLGGGCQLPIAAHAAIYYKQVRIEGMVADRVGETIIRDHVSGPSNYADKLGAQLGERLLESGADKLLAQS